MSDPVTGACLCGAVRFRVTPPTRFVGHCHCSMCRRGHGAGYVTWLVVPRTHFAIETGEDALARFDSSEHGTRSFCTRCGSSLLCESTRHPDEIDVVLANLDGAIDRPPQAHIFFSDRVDWVDVRDELPRLGGDSGTEPIEDG